MNPTVNAQSVAELRKRTGAGMVACKKALEQTKGGMEEAIIILRKKGEASAEKKAGRETSEGLIDQYIHTGGKVGVLLEINCETDFVAKTDDFKKLAKDICLHIAAANPTFVSRDQVQEAFLKKEKEILQESLTNKPANVVEKIVEGKLNKIFSEICLLEQPFVKNSEQTVQDLVKSFVATLGENIVIKRFTRYQLGE